MYSSLHAFLLYYKLAIILLVTINFHSYCQYKKGCHSSPRKIFFYSIVTTWLRLNASGAISFPIPGSSGTVKDPFTGAAQVRSSAAFLYLRYIHGLQN